MNDRDLYSHSYIKGCWDYYVEWAPKYRYDALGKDSIRTDCELILQMIAVEHHWEILELAVMPDNVHIVLRTVQPENSGKVLFYLKGRSSYELFKKHPNMRKRYPKAHYWSRGNFCRTVGVDLDVTRDYVRNQAGAFQQRLNQYS
ncbi:MAG: IS200/IS605 family transposase [Candidatus Diapherotrites archaeon]|nr:IS200/IS605 family transposase [Candidatus Diapherotrites archaeon]